jgi:hypothetical protein
MYINKPIQCSLIQYCIFCVHKIYNFKMKTNPKNLENTISFIYVFIIITNTYHNFQNTINISHNRLIKYSKLKTDPRIDIKYITSNKNYCMLYYIKRSITDHDN